MSAKIPIKVKSKSPVEVKSQSPVEKIPIKVKSKIEKKSEVEAHKEILGLYYCPNFLTDEESREIEAELKSNSKWVGVTSSQKSRRVIHYGYIYSYTGGPLQKTDEIPSLYRPVMSRFE